jgi:2',3'-cyclic-nucleotide 2'-phosphodiesterase/3'-nucleotidase/5'-nucleotidase
MMLATTVLMATMVQAPAGAPTGTGVHLHPLGTHSTGEFDRSASEIAAFHPATARLWVVSGTKGLLLLDIADPTKPTAVRTVDIGEPTSVAIHGDVVAAVVPGPAGSTGAAVFMDPDGRELARVAVGHGPDMCTFSPDGRWLLVANEGEPTEAIDPPGSISIIDLQDGPVKATARTATFDAFNSQRAALAEQGAHFAMKDATVAQQAEPEYIAIAPDGTTAYVTLQEINAMAIVDIASATVTKVVGLGLKDYSRSGLDASDKDAGIDIRPWPVYGLRQPDAVVCWTHGGTTYMATANEGEVRELGEWSEAVRVADAKLDPARFPAKHPTDSRMGMGAIAEPGNLGRMNISLPASDANGDGLLERLVGFGGRGVTIWSTANGSIGKVWDSGDQVERRIAARAPALHNADSTRGSSADRRSPTKGPEPEGLALGEAHGRRLLFCGLERPGGVVTWDVTDPAAPTLVDFAVRRDAAVDPAKALAAAGDLAPEGLLFVPASQSPNRQPLLVVCNEVSGTTTIWEVRPGAAPK